MNFTMKGSSKKSSCQSGINLRKIPDRWLFGSIDFSDRGRRRSAAALLVVVLGATGCRLPSGPGATGMLASKRSAAESSYMEQYSNARNLENAGKYDEARRIYEALIDQEPQRFEALHHLAVVNDRQKRYREAHALYRRAVDLQPEDSVLRNDFGYSLYLNGKLDAAVEQLEAAVALDGDSARCRNNLAMALGQLGRDEEALEMFKSCSSEADAHYNMAFVLASRDQFDDAMGHFQKALAVDPSHELAAQAIESFQQEELEPEQSDPQDERAASRTAKIERNRGYVPYVEKPTGARVTQVSLPNARSGSVRRALYEER